MQLAADDPDMVGSLTYCGYKAKFKADFIQWVFGRFTLISLLGMNLYAKLAIAASKARPENHAGLANFFTSTDPVAYAKVASSWDGFNILNRLPTITAPVLIIWPEYDAALGFSMNEHKRDAALYPKATLKILPGESHFVPYESPTDFVKITLDFYANHSIKVIQRSVA